MLPKPTSSEVTKTGTDFQYDGAEMGSIIEGMEQFFRVRGYRLELGKPGDGTYGTGSNFLRILFGAFAKRYSFSVKVTQSDDQSPVILHLGKAMSGAMGGVIGHGKMTKEYNAIVDTLREGIS